MSKSAFPTSPRGAAGLAAALALLGAAAGDAVAQSTLERIKAEDTIRVAVADERPYGYRDESGRITGEAPEIARKILARIDPAIEIEGTVTAFGNLMATVNAGDVDVVAAGMYITPARCEQVAFSEPTYKMGEAFTVRAGNPKDLHDFHDIAENRNAKVAIMAGAVEYNYAYEAGIPADRALLYPDYGMAVDALKDGKVDAIAMTALTVKTLIQNSDDPELEATEQFVPVIDGKPKVGYGAFAFRKEDEALLAAFNEHLNDFVGSEEHWQTVRPFGFTPDMEPDKTAAELCEG